MHLKHDKNKHKKHTRAKTKHKEHTLAKTNIKLQKPVAFYQQGCTVLVYCGTPTPARLENLGLQTPNPAVKSLDSDFNCSTYYVK